MIPVYVGKELTATAAGRKLEAVSCERCGTKYHYELTRLGVGKASAPYYLGQASAERRSASSAERDLDRRLAGEAEMVPCPKCNWVNADLVDRYRRRLYRGAPLLIGLLIGVGFAGSLLLGVGLAESFGYDSRLPGLVTAGWLALFLSSPVWVLLLRGVLRRRAADPNASFPAPPRLPPGTPPALIQPRNAHTGKARLVPVLREEPAAQTGGGDAGEWAVYRPGQVRFPNLCCVCLKPGRTTWAAPFKVNDDSDFDAPLCHGCDSDLRRRWWTLAPLAVAGAAAIAMSLWLLAYALIPAMDSPGRWGLSAIVMLFASLFGVAIVPSMLCRPYRLKVVDSDRGIVSFRAKNAGYTRLLIEQAEAADGRAAA